MRKHLPALVVVLCTIIAFLIALPPGSYDVEMTVSADDPLAERSMQGFSPIQSNDYGIYRWSLPDGLLVSPYRRSQPRILDVSMASPRPPHAPPAEAQVVVETWHSQPFIIASEWRHHRILIPHIEPESFHKIQLNVRGFTPGVHDTRRLGAAVSSFTLTYQDRPAWYLHWHGFTLPQHLLLLLIPVFAYVLTARVTTRLAPVLGGVALGLAATAIAMPLQSVPVVPSSWALLLAMVLILADPLLARTSSRYHHNRPAWLLFATMLIGFILIVKFSPLPPGMTLTNGDEPHYLLTTHSLAHDHDVNIVNNYDQEDYTDFYHLNLKAQRHLNVYKDRIILHHLMIGLPMLIMPAYAIAGIYGVFTFLNVLMALAMVALYKTMASYHPGSRKIVLAIILVLALTYPVAAYSFQVFPETLAFVCVSVALALILSLSASRVPLHAFSTGCLLGILPHLNFKMALLSATLFAFLLWKGRYHLRTVLAWSLGPILVFAGLFFAWLYAQYGELSPDILNALPGFARYKQESSLIQGTLGLWFDQKFGLFFNAPLYLMALPGWLMLWRARERRDEAIFFFIIYASYHLMHGSYVNWSSGASPLPRYIIPVLPLLIICTVYATVEYWRRAQWVQPVVLGCLSIWMTVLILNNRLLMYEFSGTDNTFFQQFDATTIMALLPPLRYGTPAEAYPRLGLVLLVVVLFWYSAGVLNRALQR